MFVCLFVFTGTSLILQIKLQKAPKKHKLFSLLAKTVFKKSLNSKSLTANGKNEEYVIFVYILLLSY